jgi:hypothetical protein
MRLNLSAYETPMPLRAKKSGPKYNPLEYLQIVESSRDGHSVH